MAIPGLLRDLEDVLWWKGELVDDSGVVHPALVPNMLMTSFPAWRPLADNGIPHPWELHGWLSTLDRAYKHLARRG